MQILVEKAKQAMSEPDQTRSEFLLVEMLIMLEGQFADDQKEIAQALQRVSKELEAQGQQESAFKFKQRTCELMLKRSMELRMKARLAQSGQALASKASTSPVASTDSLSAPGEAWASKPAGNKSPHVSPAVPFVSTMPPALVARSKEAARESDPERAEGIYTEIIRSLEEMHGKNQKEVAAALKQLSRELEVQGLVDESFKFKQRTCEVLLKMSMSERRRTIPDS